jgi:hypothetical protein
LRCSRDYPEPTQPFGDLLKLRNRTILTRSTKQLLLSKTFLNFGPTSSFYFGKNTFRQKIKTRVIGP